MLAIQARSYVHDCLQCKTTARYAKRNGELRRKRRPRKGEMEIEMNRADHKILQPQARIIEDISPKPAKSAVLKKLRDCCLERESPVAPAEMPDQHVRIVREDSSGIIRR